MSNYTEKFEKMRIAGKLAAQTLDMLTDNIKEGVTTDYIDKLGYEFIRDNGGYSAPLYYRGFKKSLCTSLLIMLFVMVYHLKIEFWKKEMQLMLMLPLSSMSTMEILVECFV